VKKKKKMAISQWRNEIISMKYLSINQSWREDGGG
jgi:hypothetical protein